MKKSPAIALVETKAAFQEKLVEKYLQQNLPPMATNQDKLSGMGNFTDRFKVIECCAAETPLTGNVELFLTPALFKSARKIRIPVKSRFFVFCTRDDKDDYKVTWSSSLS